MHTRHLTQSDALKLARQRVELVNVKYKDVWPTKYWFVRHEGHIYNAESYAAARQRRRDLMIDMALTDLGADFETTCAAQDEPGSAAEVVAKFAPKPWRAFEGG